MTLVNSSRGLDRATYTPVDARVGKSGNALARWQVFTALEVSEAEIDAVAARWRRREGRRGAGTGDRPLSTDEVDLLRGLPRGPSALASLADVEAFARVPDALLARLGRELLTLRAESHDEVMRTLRQGAEDGRARAGGASTEPRRPVPPPGFKRQAAAAIAGFAREAVLYRLEATESRSPAREGRVNLHGSTGAVLFHAPDRDGRSREGRDAPIPLSQALASAGASASDVLTKARRLVAQAADLTVEAYQAAAGERLHTWSAHLTAYEKLLGLAQVGYLHLERLEFIPDGIERGELVHSVPLSPAEEVNIAHKEWSNTSEEFDRIVTDFLEEFSEQGVTDKSELSRTTAAQEQHSRGFTLGVTASGGFGPVSLTTSTNLNLQDSATMSEQVARRQSSDLTQRASSRAKQEHKISFKVASASGVEDQAVRRIRNPFTDRAVRVDYYQLVRKWRVDLYRYGVRLTYDLVIPEPGSDLLARLQEISELEALLEHGFDDPAAPEWARFDLVPGQLSADNYPVHAARYGIEVEGPPQETIRVHQSFSHTFSDEERSDQRVYTRFDIPIPDDYVIAGYGLTWEASQEDNDDAEFAFHPADLDRWLGASDKVTLTIGTRLSYAFNVEVDLTFGPRDGLLAAWQLKTWAALRDAARNRFTEQVAAMRDRLARLQADLGAQDPLSLRQAEREEVMKGVLRWLFGPSFTFAPPNVPDDLYGPDESVVSDAVWSATRLRGEVVRFLHHAIEWENMLYVLYPYFWSHTSRWDLKKYLDHPDLTHRAFLRAGAARVVVTIRPGFEVAFAALLDAGAAAAPGSVPYRTIAEEVQAYAQTNYPGIRPANPVQDARPLLTPRQRLAWQQLQQIIAALEQSKATRGRYPTSAEGLSSLPGGSTLPQRDPWGGPFSYTAPGILADYELASLGSDGAPGGDGEAADITSWAEASLIGQWHEYTPTSALDIAFDEVLPSE